MANDLSGETATAMCYPPKVLYEDWKDEADKWDTSVSAWIQHMVEAGRKEFEVGVQVDESAQELRRQRNDLKKELRRTRSRVDELETQLHDGERAEILSFLKQNPGASASEIVQHLAYDLPNRTHELLERMEGREIETDDGEHYRRVGDGA